MIFDCDGVLVDSEGIANRVWVDALARHGLIFTHAEFVKRAVGRTLPDLYAELLRDHAWEPPNGFDDTLNATLLATFDRELVPVPGVRELLVRLRVPVCVASNSHQERLWHKLRLTGLEVFFGEAVYSAHEVPRGKPHPDLFLHAARRAGARPERCLVIEDSVTGVTAGRAAGMTVWGFTGVGYATPDELCEAGAVRVFADMLELAGALDGGIDGDCEARP